MQAVEDLEAMGDKDLPDKSKRSLMDKMKSGTSKLKGGLGKLGRKSGGDDDDDGDGIIDFGALL